MYNIDEQVNVEKLNDKLFELNELPEIISDVSEIVEEINKEIIDNYVALAKDAKNTLVYSYENNLSKPIVFYNLFYYLEIFLKMYLMLNSTLKLNEIDNFEHDICGMKNYININNSVNFDGLMYLLRKFKDRNKKSLNYSKYYDYKYNKRKNSDDLIFELDLNEDDIKNIKDVIEWLDSHMSI